MMQFCLYRLISPQRQRVQRPRYSFSYTHEAINTMFFQAFKDGGIEFFIFQTTLKKIRQYYCFFLTGILLIQKVESNFERTQVSTVTIVDYIALINALFQFDLQFARH